jgi:hypothetical protein
MAISKQQQADILTQIADGLSLSEICRKDGMPARSKVHQFIVDDAEFRDKYARACEVRAETIFDEMFDIADDGTNDWVERSRADGSSETVLNGEHVQRSRLRIEARKWALSKMNPKKYGEKLDVDHGGQIQITIASADAGL